MTSEKTRQYLRQRITRLATKVQDELISLDQDTRLNLLEKARELKEDIVDIDRSIFKKLITNNTDEATLNKHSDESDYYKSLCRSLISKLEASLNIQSGIFDNSQTSDSSHTNGHHVNKLKLPNVPLPTFSKAKNQSLEKFFHEFESVINKHTLTSYEKFIYLRNQLSDAPLTLVNSLDVREQSYEAAKEILKEAFGDNTTVKFDVIKQLSQLKLKIGNDPYKFAAEMRTVIAAFISLSIDIDCVLQFFIWNAFNEIFQNQLIQITNSNKPELREIENNIFPAIERYNIVMERKQVYSEDCYKNAKNKPIETANMAVKVDTEKSNRQYTCHLCKNDKASSFNHKMKDCTVYNSASKRVNKLKSINACTKCSFLNHSTEKCKFKFATNCRNCSKPHMTYLCLRDLNFNKNHSINKVETSSHYSYVEVMQASSLEDSLVLPTFTCEATQAHKTETIRVFKDGGCQRNFITSDIAQKLGLLVLRDSVELIIHGFNSSKKISTKIVQVPLVINSNTHLIEAIITPEIRTKIVVPGMNKIVDAFTSKGHLLADKNLQNNRSECIDKISLILGADADHVVPMIYKQFGPKLDSSYIDTPLGVMISGNITRMLRNLSFLPCGTSELVGLTAPPGPSKEGLGGAVLGSTGERINVNCFQSIEETIEDYLVLNENGELNENELERATSDTLDKELKKVLNYDTYTEDPAEAETNVLVSKYVLDTLEFDTDGRMIARLPWNGKNKHLLAKNFHLSKQILNTNLSKLSKCPDKLAMYDKVFRDQEELGIIEKIVDIQEFMKLNPNCSFLPHMGVYRMEKETTKCRVVFLSNLAERPDKYVSHNKAMLPGPNLNSKIFFALTLLRFDKYLLLFDIQKAFLNIKLHEIDQNKLVFLWYNNISRNDYSLVAYRNLRLSFGLRSSPAILMLCLYHMLVLDNANCDARTEKLKLAIYESMYMDNGGISCNDVADLRFNYEKLPEIFSKFKFNLQQYVSNSDGLGEEVSTEETKLLGMTWNTKNDTLKVSPFMLDIDAKTKRSVLKTLASVYDVLNIYLPLLNRAKLFMRDLQTNSLRWDDNLPPEQLSEWRRICRQVNSVPQLEVPRSIGTRAGSYSVHAFTDSSKLIYGTVIYVRNDSDGNISFLHAKNKLINKKLSIKTIPSLELLAITFGLETMLEIYDGLCGPSTFNAINVTKLNLYTDSLVCLHWIQARVTDYSKMNKKPVFVLNKLRAIDTLCQKQSVKFHFTQGKLNPADHVTRACSHKILSGSCYLTGPKHLINQHGDESYFSVIVPNPDSMPVDEVPKGKDDMIETINSNMEVTVKEQVVSPSKYNSITKLARVYARVLLFVNNLKLRVENSNENIVFAHKYNPCNNFFSTAMTQIIRKEQELKFPEEYDFLTDYCTGKSNTPELAARLNLFMDPDGIIRVKCKFDSRSEYKNPILLPKNSDITRSIIWDYHSKYKHSGLYYTIKQLRDTFYIVHCFSTVKKELLKCTVCKRLNSRKVIVNQNSYREERVSPPKIPFSYVYLDYFGPYDVKLQGTRKKVYILIVTCMWTRAVSLQICQSLNVHDFLRAVQLHVFRYGMFQHCFSDLGTQIVAGSKIITDWLNDIETTAYFNENGVKTVKFDQYCKGNSALGSLVEITVKQSKNLVFKSIRNNVPDFFDFQFIIEETICLINKRPLTFKNGLRDSNVAPECITPEMLLTGRELITLNIIPESQETEGDPDWNASPDVVRQHFQKLQKLRTSLKEKYHSEFLQTLVDQAVDKPSRYLRKTHQKLQKGDIVLITEKYSKPSTYPLGLVKSVETNSLGEVTAARILKGKTREIVYRHASTLVLLIPSKLQEESSEKDNVGANYTVHETSSQVEGNNSSRPLRSSSTKAKALNKQLIRRGLV